MFLAASHGQITPHSAPLRFSRKKSSFLIPEVFLVPCIPNFSDTNKKRYLLDIPAFFLMEWIPQQTLDAPEIIIRA
jgi:hypothetical protein